MKLLDAEKMFVELASRYLDDDWGFDWSNAFRTLGCCKWIIHNGQIEEKWIELSRPFVSANNERVVRDTILHEIAHGIAGHKAKHGWEWKHVARKIGCIPRASCMHPELVIPTAPYHFKCPCGMTHPFFRWPNYPDRKCRRCGYKGRVTRNESFRLITHD